MAAENWQARSVPDLIIEVWEALDCESVGTHELERIQEALREKFGEGALLSPAAIARAVADEGAVLRHPEVFECDLIWRKRLLARGGMKDQLDFTDLSSAFESLVRIEERRLRTEGQGGIGEKGKGERVSGARNKESELKELRNVVMAARDEALLRARSRILEEDQRRQSKEISEWLKVWLQSPELFSDWLDLRRRSPEFRSKFPEVM
jgi:hypothetical protein